ncbi:MAG: hypothetical protein NE327_10680 [Lentisphaeraceae bacterium]|nr:hypothetical protein [Lentisphaeraceae bacterium]
MPTESLNLCFQLVRPIDVKGSDLMIKRVGHSSNNLDYLNKVKGENEYAILTDSFDHYMTLGQLRLLEAKAESYALKQQKKDHKNA